MQAHTTIGFQILKQNTNSLGKARTGCIEHHEKLDGSGYPKGTGEISECGQILSIIDCYEAITNDDRPYRSAMDPLRALEMMKEETDSGKFNREIFEDFAYSLTDFTKKNHQKKYHHIFKK